MTDNDSIKRGDVKDVLEHAYYGEASLGELLEKIDGIPIADVVSVVRCGDCRNCHKDDPYTLWCTGRGFPSQLVPPDGYCDRGKRKETV